jgi:hypothetical protein
MKEWLTLVTEYAIVIIDALALVIIFVGTIEAFISAFRLVFFSPSGHVERDVWLLTRAGLSLV